MTRVIRLPISLTMSGITQSGIARKLNISRSTVAAVLTNSSHSRISSTTRDRILQTAKEMGYVPNRHAQIMSKGKSGTIGIVTFGSTGITAQKEQVAVESVHAAGYDPIQHNVHWYADSGDKACRRMIELRVEGVILIHPTILFTQKHLDILLTAGIPVVALGSSILNGIIRYMSDKEQGFHDLTQYLISLGHRRLSLLLGEDDLSRIYEKESDHPPTWHRWKARLGFEKAVSEHPSVQGEVHIARYELRRPGSDGAADPHKAAYEATKQLLSGDELPDVILCSNDTWAHGALAACAEADLRVPHDVAVTGFENESFSPYGFVPLTTMAHPAAQMAFDGTRHLIAQINKEEPPTDRLVILPCELVIRRSCGGYLQKHSI